MNVSQKLDGAAILADAAAPYFSQARATLRMIPSKDCPTMGVDDKWRCYYNKEFVEKLEPRELAYVLIHEVQHLVRKHSDRAKVFGITRENHVKWNIAADISINIPDFNGLPRPKDVMTPELFKLPKDKLEEWYYNNLPKDAGKNGKGKGDGKGSKGQPDGSGSDGVAREWELGGDDPKNPGLSDIDAEGVIRNVAAAVEEYEKNNGRGNMPAGISLWAKSITKPQVSWKNQLRCAISQGVSRMGLGDRTYRRIRVRNGIISPRHHKISPNIVIVCDTSGSMGCGDGSRLQKALSEVIGIAKISGSVAVCWTDTNPILQRNVRRLSDCKVTGGGGTDMVAGIDFADGLKNGEAADLIVLLTDGECSWHTKPPKHRLVTVIIGQAAGPGFGKVIRIQEGGE